MSFDISIELISKVDDLKWKGEKSENFVTALQVLLHVCSRNVAIPLEITKIDSMDCTQVIFKEKVILAL